MTQKGSIIDLWLVSKYASERFFISVWFLFFHDTLKSHLKWIWSETFWSGIGCFSRILLSGQKVFYIKVILLHQNILCLIFLMMQENPFQQMSLITFSFILKSRSHLPKKIVICFIESSLKMTKRNFYFILKVLFVLKIFKFLSWLFGHAGKKKLD